MKKVELTPAWSRSLAHAQHEIEDAERSIAPMEREIAKAAARRDKAASDMDLILAEIEEVVGEKVQLLLGGSSVEVATVAEVERQAEQERLAAKAAKENALREDAEITSKASALTEEEARKALEEAQRVMSLKTRIRDLEHGK